MAILCLLALLLFSCDVSGAKRITFKLAPYDSMVESMEFHIDASPSSNASSRYGLAVRTTSSLNIFISGSTGCPKSQLVADSGNIDFEIPEDTWKSAVECGMDNGVIGKIYLRLESMKNEALGTVDLYRIPQTSEATGILQNDDSGYFVISDRNSYSRKVKLQSLLDNVKVIITSESIENALEVYITFCSTKKGVLYTTSYAPSFEISLGSPQIESYYDAYSCDSSIAFYGNSTQPTAPLIIRLESRSPINGTVTVLLNGGEPSIESHVAEYETGTFTLNSGETKITELKYQPTMRNIRAYLDIVTGAMVVYLSPCKTEKNDVFYSNFTTGSHQVNIDLEAIMENTTCSLVEIDPNVIYMLMKPAVTTTFTLWIPGQPATWHIVITIGLIFLLLTISMIIIVYFGRRKTGKLIINNFQ